MTSFEDLIALPEDGSGDGGQQLKPACWRCYDTESELLPANCAEKPELLVGVPLGQYHCPDCGAMILAGMPHGPLCRRCHDRQHPGFDRV